MDARGLVRAMLVPHRRENPQFSETRHPPDQLEDALILVGLQAMAGDEFGGDLGLVHGCLNRKIEGVRKGLLWRISALSRALRGSFAGSAFAHRSRIRFKGGNTQLKGHF